MIAVTLPAKSFLIGLLFLFCMPVVRAQEVTLSGKITGAAGQLVSGELYIVHPDSGTLVKTGIFENGYVTVPGIPLSRFMVKVTAREYADTAFLVQTATGSYDFGTLVLNSRRRLETATVRARAPLFAKTTEGTKINVENSVLSGSISAVDLLSKSPGLIVEKNKVSVFGRGQALLYLNGKPVPFEMVQSLPVSRIRSVEIITNPSAKYEAGSMAVINIITKKGGGPNGFLGEITQSATFAVYYLHDAAVNLNYKKDKLSLTADYAGQQGYDWLRAHFFRRFNYTGGSYLNEAFQEEKTINSYNAFRFGANYVLNRRSDISVQYDGIHNENAPDVTIDNQVNEPNGAFSRVFTFNNAFNGNNHHSINLNLNHALDTLGSTLFTGVQVGAFRNRLLDQIEEQALKYGIAQPGNYRVTDGDNQIRLFAAQADVTRMLGGDSRLETGARFAVVTNHGRVNFRSRPLAGGAFTEFPQFANNFLYREKVPALYLQYYAPPGKKLTYSAGLRLEYSFVQGYSRIVNKQVIDTSYLNVFPNLRADYTLSSRWSLSFSYSGRINRPAYQDIDPFVWYLDSLTSVQGNPQLVPEKLSSSELTLSYRKFNLRLNYVRATHSFRRLALPGNAGANSVIYRNMNLDLRQLYQATLELPFEKGNWQAFTSFSMGLEKFSDARPGYVQRNTLMPHLLMNWLP